MLILLLDQKPTVIRPLSGLEVTHIRRIRHGGNSRRIRTVVVVALSVRRTQQALYFVFIGADCTGFRSTWSSVFSSDWHIGKERLRSRRVLGEDLRGIGCGLRLIRHFSRSAEMCLKLFHSTDSGCLFVVLSTTTACAETLRLDDGIDGRKGTSRIIPLDHVELGNQTSDGAFVCRSGR